MGKGNMFEQLHYVQWQPYVKGTFKKPVTLSLLKQASEEEKTAPKRVFAFGGSNSAFA